ncbi:MAG: LysR family transcriptional regulator [Archangium gephyra]|uniref:LysR family transcriptional regulator n=1 Tax=Archangium gephyra TaxID=48 RepID=A0A2W5ULN5_9BACT|nr:MAG: LysR family transcriptional regulator [Archangium gephyra]
MSVSALDWNDVRFFLAVAQTGRVARAARSLGVDQTTVTRRIASLESRLRAELFTRGASGWSLTVAGERVSKAARRMAEAAEEVASQDDEALDGVVRIATSETIAEYFVPAALKHVQLRHPGIRAVVNTGFSRVDLLRGEADLAIRLVRPTDARLASRRVARRFFRLYASPDYLARRGEPADDLAGHSIVTYDEALRVDGAPFRHLELGRVTHAFEANSARVLVAAAVAGLGVVQLPDYVGDATPALVHVLPGRDVPYAIWLVVPQSKRRSGIVRIVADAIAATFTQRSEP